MAGAHAHVYRVIGADGEPDRFEVECPSCELLEVHDTKREAELAAGDHDDARHSE